jgi:hypothetical protein
MKVNLIFILLAVLVCQAQAKVPYKQIEDLRRQSIVTRVLMDFPESKPVTSCKVKDISIGSKLMLHLENAKASWAQATLLKEDLETLKSKIKICELRGSCQVYENFLAVVQADKSLTEAITSLKNDLEVTQKNIKSSTYLTAWKSVPTPCQVLKKLVQSE